MEDDAKTRGGDGGGGFPGLDFARTVQQFGQLSAASVTMWSAWARTWETVLRERGWPAFALLGHAADAGRAAEGDAESGAASFGDSLEQAFGLPRLADIMSVDVQALRVLEPSFEMLQVGRDYTLVAGQVWVEACRRFQERLDEGRREGSRPESAGEVLDTWNEVVDQTLIAFNRSEEFADLQRRFLRATMRHRLERRRLAEKVCELYDVPTRSEVDELHQKMHNLQREVRRLRRGAGARAEVAPAAEESSSRERPAPSRPRSATG